MIGLFGTQARTKADLLSGVTKGIAKSKLLARSTLEIIYTDGSRAIRYHDTDVLTIKPDGSIVLNSGGYRTSTTKARINEHAKIISVHQDRGNWYVTKNRYKIENGKYIDLESADRPVHLYYDGITFSETGDLISESKELDSKRINGLKKKIAAYCKLVDSADPIPFPDSGDCFYCLMKEQKTGKPLGDCTGDHDHLLSHISEKYLHGSIIFNALTEKGYRDPAFIIHVRHNEAIKRSLRSYLIKRLIPDVSSR